jgi:2-polyprenyl-3-methyl-5-hydroxy-6-metoxy-1,4-benzoquinol methylase
MLAHLSQAAHAAEAFILWLPQRRQPRAQHLLRRLRLRQYLGRRLGRRYTPVDPGPPAPPEFVVQTSLLPERGIEENADPEGYFADGYLGTLMHLETLERFGFDLGSAQAVLDFGCGDAKNIRLLRGIRDLRLVGTDVNATQIEWARKHVPGVEFHVNELEPPLRFAEDDTFDLVSSASIFTHIPLHLQRPWLEEIRRILRPRGYFVCTVAGAHHIHVQLLYATKAAGSWDVFQTREEVPGSFDSMFEVLDNSASESAQDTLVLRKQ